MSQRDEIAGNFRQELNGDGMLNGQEFLAGTDPTNNASFLKLTLAVPGQQPSLSFGAVSNRTYTIQFTDALPAAPWQKLADVLARTTNRAEIIADPAWTTNRFYRAVTPRQP